MDAWLLVKEAIIVPLLRLLDSTRSIALRLINIFTREQHANVTRSSDVR
jgi:hypothetical protein